MSNIISSDFYRVRKGSAVRNTFLSVGILMIFFIVMMTILQPKMSSVSDMADTQNMTAADLAEMEEMEEDLQELQQESETLNNGIDYAKQMLGQSFLFYFFLPIAIAVFCADFTAGTYRNTLSYESNRTRVYLAKLILSVCLSFALVISTMLICWLSGSIFLGFGGITAASVANIVISILLQTPLLLAAVAVCHCLIAFTKKSSTTIAIFLVGAVAVTIILQLLSAKFPTFEWLVLLDPQNGGGIMANYEFAATGDLLLIGGYNLLVAAIATVVGALYYRKADMP